MSAPNGTYVVPPLSTAETEAVQAHNDGSDHYTISTLTGLSVAKVRAAIERDKLIRLNAPKQGSAIPAQRTQAVPEVLPAPAPAAGVKSAAEPKANLGELLKWADDTGPARVRTLAARIRDGIGELRRMHANDSVRSAAVANVARLEAELAAAKQAVREASGKPKTVPVVSASPAPSSDRKAYLAAMRAWGRANGHELSDYGQVRHDVEAAYLAAMGGGS